MCFLNNEISGMHVSDEIIKMYEGKTKEEAEKLAVELSVKIMHEIEDTVDGFYLMTPFNRVELMTEILKAYRM